MTSDPSSKEALRIQLRRNEQLQLGKPSSQVQQTQQELHSVEAENIIYATDFSMAFILQLQSFVEPWFFHQIQTNLHFYFNKFKLRYLHL